MNREELRKMIPQGYMKVIAARSGVSQKSVSHFMSGRTSHSERIETAALEVLAEISERRKALIKKIA